ncbi:MAG: hypothetical protein JW881_17395 [Spirochaetales bacterium]|nr:hypothetical protein [Spirochaetales bacterium]
MKKLYVIVIIIVSCPFFLCAQTDKLKTELETWYKSHPQAGKYTGIKEQLLSLFQEAEQRSIPGVLLMEKLQEGSSKGVLPDRLLEALKDEMERLSDIIAMIAVIDIRNMEATGKRYFEIPAENSGFEDISGFENKDIRSMPDIIKQISLFQRSGIPLGNIGSILDYARTIQKNRNIAFQALSALIKIPGVSTLSTESLVALGESLLRSKLSPSSYSTLSSIFLKGRIYQMSYTTISGIVIEVLDNGGGLIQIEQEITRRGRKR